MNLAVISNVRGCSWAGSETVWHAAAIQALAEGHSVTAFLHPDISEARQVKVFRQSGGRLQQWRTMRFGRLQAIKDKFLSAFPTKILNQFDAVLVSLGSLPAVNYVPGLVNGLLATSTPYILFCQFNSDHLAMAPTERDVVHNLIEQSAACAFVANRNLVEARRQFGITPARSSIILNCVPPQPAPRTRWPSLDVGVSFANVARLETAWKGQDLLLDVLSQPAWKDRDWTLHFYGSGPDESHLRKLKNLFGLQRRVHFHGFISQLEEIWSQNHILVMPSHGEGTPLAALEAMAFGRPVIATDVGGNTEIVQDGVTGFIADAATLSSFGKTMERAWHARDQWPTMGSAAHQYICDRSVYDPAGELLRVWTAAASAN